MFHVAVGALHDVPFVQLDLHHDVNEKHDEEGEDYQAQNQPDKSLH